LPAHGQKAGFRRCGTRRLRPTSTRTMWCATIDHTPRAHYHARTHARTGGRYHSHYHARTHTATHTATRARTRWHLSNIRSLRQVRVHLMVHDTKPPFLEGFVVDMSKQVGPGRATTGSTPCCSPAVPRTVRGHAGTLQANSDTLASAGRSNAATWRCVEFLWVSLLLFILRLRTATSCVQCCHV
jgi:hypothetical protein